MISFSASPHAEAIARLKNKPIVSRQVFDSLLPSLKTRAFTITGVEDAKVLRRIRDLLADVPAGATPKEALGDIAAELEPYLGEEGSKIRAETLLNAQVFQAYSASTYMAAQADEDTTHLQYIHGDTADVPTPEHLALDGIILPKGDDFWQTHTGPWGHFGCVCYVRPMNPDLVEMERMQDENRNPEDARVIEGPALDRLRQGQLQRGTRSFNVSAPTDPNAFQWNPASLDIPLDAVRKQFEKDPEAWQLFELKARQEEVAPGVSLWRAMQGSALKARQSVGVREYGSKGDPNGSKGVMECGSKGEVHVAPQDLPPSPTPLLPCSPTPPLPHSEEPA